MATKKPAPRSKPKKKNPVPVVARNPSSPLERSIADGMARAFHVSAWADREEELGRLRGGQELMDVAPPTTEEAKQEAWKLIGSMETANGMNLPAIFAQALIADGKTTKDLPEGWVSVAEDNAEEFGHYMAMQSLGHGVSWFDDHKEFTIPQVSGRGKKFVVPHTEFYYFDPSEYGGEPAAGEGEPDDRPHYEYNPNEPSAPRRAYEDNPAAEGARFAGRGPASQAGGFAGGSASPRRGGGFADNPHPQNDEHPRPQHDENPRPQPSAPRRAYEDNPRGSSPRRPDDEAHARIASEIHRADTASEARARIASEIDRAAERWGDRAYDPGTTDSEMRRAYLSDAADLHRIASAFRHGNDHEAFTRGERLDTIVRDQLPDSFWKLVQAEERSGFHSARRRDDNPRQRTSYDDNPRRPAPRYEENHRTPAEGAWSRPERYEFAEGSSNKFWEIQIGDRKIRTHFGRIGYEGQIWTSPKLRSEEEAGAEYDRLVREKRRKGYQKVRAVPRSASTEGRGLRRYDANPR